MRRFILAALVFVFVFSGSAEAFLASLLPGIDVDAGVAEAQDDAAARRARRRRARRRRARRRRQREAEEAESTESDSGDGGDAAASGDTGGGGGGGDAPSLAAGQENNLEFEGSNISGETAGRGAVVLYNRGGRAFEPLARMQRRFLRTSVLSLFGTTKLEPEERRSE